MNYSKDSRQQSETAKESKKKKKKTKKRKLTLLRILLIAFIILMFAAFGAGLGMFIGIIKSAPDVSEIVIKPMTHYTSFVYDQNGEEVAAIDAGENRIYATLDEIPQHLQDAVIAIEDERFYKHNGIDIRGILRAIVTNIKSGSFDEGASTITQQLIKNNVLTSEKKISRKIQEQYLALQVEKIYDKDLILEYYLNTMALGHGTYGVKAASYRYFNKDVSELTLAESVVIAGITQAPTRYSPILNPENNWEKAHRILNKMVEQGMITEDQRDAALEENPYTKIYEVNEHYAENSTHSYFVDATIKSVKQDLIEKKGLSDIEAHNLIYGGGIQIYSTLDQGMQNTVDTYMNDESIFPENIYEIRLDYRATIVKPDGTEIHRGAEGIVQTKDEIEDFKKAKQAEWGYEEGDKLVNEYLFEIPQPQAAFVIMDHHNGHVKALSGGRGEKYGDLTFNRATQSTLQSGSTFKILAAYAPALDTGLLSPGSIIVDEPFEKGNYKPKNWYRGYRGPSTVREGVYDSMNILAVKTLDMLGVQTALQYLKNFGFTTLGPNDQNLALALGGLSTGVTPLELNAAYAALANQGTYIEPILYTKVLDRDGNILMENIPESHTVVKESTASMLTDMMEDVVNKGTGGHIRSFFSSMPIAGKTGTTNDNKDLLFAGYTPYYTATVWTGFDQPKDLGARNSRYHLELWAKIMKDIHTDLPAKQFEKNTSGYVKATVCSLSGKIPTELCKLDDEHPIVTDYFLASEVSDELCDLHVEKRICNVSGKIATEYCPEDQIKIRTTALTPGSSPEAVNPEDLCNVHTAETVPGFPSWPDVTWPWDPNDPAAPEVPDTPDPENPDITDPGEPEEPSIPEVPPTAPSGPEDETDDFFIPQG